MRSIPTLCLASMAVQQAVAVRRFRDSNADRQAHATRLPNMHTLAADGGCLREQANENGDRQA